MLFRSTRRCALSGSLRNLLRNISQASGTYYALFDEGRFGQYSFMDQAGQFRQEKIDCGGIVLSCGDDDRALIMGILNVTPDSFSDGGLYMDPAAAVDRAGQMIEEGADIIDIGGESTRPAGSTYGAGARTLETAEELQRVLPVVEAVASAFPDMVVSVDTYKSDVAREAAGAGARMINDITAFRADPAMPAAVADTGLPVVLMHSVGLPGDMPHEYQYADLVDNVKTGLRSAVETAEAHGIDGIIIDPGFGFGKSVSGNLRLIAQLGRFRDFGRPILVGISRKSTVGAVLESGSDPRPIDGRLFGSLAATTVALMNGASIVRTHDVASTLDTARMVHALAQAGFKSQEVQT